MKFPLSMTASLAGYILKNKMRPRPEWQKAVTAEVDASNPFRILPAGTGEKTGEKRQPHTISRSLRAYSERLANAGCDHTTGLPGRRLLASRMWARLIS